VDAENIIEMRPIDVNLVKNVHAFEFLEES
jgi:hypothetical protein